MTRIEVRGDLEKSMKRFKVKVARSGILSDLKKHKYHEKPGVKRRREQEEMTKNARKKRKD